MFYAIEPIFLMNQLLNYFAFLLTVVGALLTLLQSVYLVWLRFGLFPFTPQPLDPESLDLKKMNVDFIQHMISLLLIGSAVEISLFWLLVVLNIISRRRGLVATLVLVVIVGFVVLFAFTASIV